MKKGKRTFVRAIKWVLLAGTAGLAGFVMFAAVTLLRLDAWTSFDPQRILGADQTLILYDMGDREITRLHGLEDRIHVDVSTLPSHVKYAFISAEDARFYSHRGVDIIRIFGAAWEDIKAGGYVQGASTISQQLIKLSHLSNEKTMTRKLEEAVLSLRMERLYTKDEILEMYLNYVYFGGGYYGIESAALGYYGVHAAALTAAQAAQLAGILKAPSAYAPHLHPKASVERRDLILGLMYEYGYLTAAERDAARGEAAEILRGAATGERGYYVDAALGEAASLLGVGRDTLLTGGYRIYTAMDAELQAYCEALMEEEALFPAPDVQAAAVVQRAGSGFVAAMVGGRGESAALSFNRVTDIRRQPGSVIKPILCYAPALEEKGYTAASMLLDEKEAFGEYTPNNFGSRYYGWVRLRVAVEKSLNVPAVRVLSDLGVERAKSFAEKLGVVFDDTDTSLALALGGFTYGVSPWMLSGAYNCFASGGVYWEPTLIRAITDANGQVLYRCGQEGTRVLSPQNAYILTSMLQSVVSTGTGRRLGELGIDLAGKTGTVGESESNRDAWMAAYNPAYTAVVWMGYDSAGDGALPEEATGGRYPALVLREIYAHLYAEAEAPSFVMPEGIVEKRLDRYSAEKRHTIALATAFTPASSVITEVFVEGTEPAAQSEYWTVPLPVEGFSLVSGPAGYPKIGFTPRQSFVVYKLYRRDESGNTKCVAQWQGGASRIDHTDDTVRAGVGYTYYIVPEHAQMQVGGNAVAGPASAGKYIEVAALRLGSDGQGGPSAEAPLDLTGLR